MSPCFKTLIFPKFVITKVHVTVMILERHSLPSIIPFLHFLLNSVKILNSAFLKSQRSYLMSNENDLFLLFRSEKFQKTDTAMFSSLDTGAIKITSIFKGAWLYHDCTFTINNVSIRVKITGAGKEISQ